MSSASVALAGGDGEPTDLRLVPAAGAAWLAAGWGTGATAGTALLAAGGCLAAVTGAVLLLRRRPSTELALAALAATLVLLSVSAQLALQSAGLLPDLVGQRATATVEAVVRSDPRPVRPKDSAAPGRPGDDAPRFVVVLGVDRVTGRGATGDARADVLVVSDSRWSAVRPGQRVVTRGRLVPAEPGDDVVALLLPTTGPTGLAPARTPQRQAERLRAGLREAAAPLPADSAGLLPGLVVGDTSKLPHDLDEAMRTTGLTHLTAVSGSNVAIVCGTVLLVAGACGARRRTRLSLAALALAGFVVLARPDPSVLRAAVMGSIGLAGLASARRGRGMPALSAAVVVLTVADPWLGRAFGFALSVLATCGLLLLARPWADALARVLPRPLALAVAVPAAAQAVCAPVIVLLTPQLSLSAVPANLLVAPAVAPATVLGVLATVLAPWWAAGAQAVAWLGGWFTWWVATVARTTAAVPGSAVPWPDGRRGALLLAAATLAGVLLLPLAVSAVARVPRLLARASWQRLTGAVVAVCVVAGVLLWPPSPVRGVLTGSWPPPGWRLVACDVGQGDALVLSTGRSSAVVVDAGPDPDVVDACLRRLGVREVHLLVVTHFHADHAAGVQGVLRGRRVHRALVSPLAEPERQARSTLRALGSAGVAASAGTAGTAGRVADLRWRVLWPGGGPAPAGAAGAAGATGAAEGESSAANDASVVVLVEQPGLRVLTTGDLEPAAQVGLRRALPGLRVELPVDVLKVAHHGSARQDAALHRLLAPRLALVSAGADNDYGHPAPATLDLLRDVGAVVVRTDRLGDVAVGGDARHDGAGGLWVDGRRGDPSLRAGPARRPAEPDPARSCPSAVAGFVRGQTCSPVAPGVPGAGGAGHRPRGAARGPGGPAGPGRPARAPPGSRDGRGRRGELRDRRARDAHQPVAVR